MTLTTLFEVTLKNFEKSAHIYRQILAITASSLLSISAGLIFGYSAVLLPQLASDVNFSYDSSFDSWIASITPLSMALGCLFSGTMSDYIGRRNGMLVLTVPFIIGWILMAISNSNALMLIGRFLVGIIAGAVRPNSVIYISELTDPKYRALALLCPSLAVHIGIFISHIVGKYVYWKTSCFLFIIPNILCFVMNLFFKESPLWLLHKGKIDEGIQSFRWFRGEGENVDKELNHVLETCKKNTTVLTIKEIFQIIFSKSFMMCLFTTCLLFIATQFSGVNTLSFYAEGIYNDTFFGNLDGFLLMIITDCIRIAAGLVNCMLAKVIPQKVTFIACCFVTSFALLGVAIYTYIKPVGLLGLAVTCMVIYVAASSGVTNISWSFISEIFPAKIRGIASGISCAIAYVFLFISVKITPEISTNFGITAMYIVFLVATLVSGVFLMFLLPHTNSKSLQQIEDELYKGVNNKESSSSC